MIYNSDSTRAIKPDDVGDLNQLDDKLNQLYAAQSNAKKALNDLYAAQCRTIELCQMAQIIIKSKILDAKKPEHTTELESQCCLLDRAKRALKGASENE